MSAFLWVEDFEGKQYREFSSKLFGPALRLDSTHFPDNEIELKLFLRRHQIYLITHFADARRFIAEHLHDVDSIILDIDLNLMGEDIDSDETWVLPVLKRWYFSTEGKDANEEAIFDEARTQMKQVAGYHLFMELVMERRFPKESILFCSNHADYLKHINEAFHPAKIEQPPIWQKDHAHVGRWVAEKHGDCYLRLRRWIAIGCDNILSRLREGQVHFLARAILGENEDKWNISAGDPIDRAHAELLLETLPKILGEHEQDANRRRVMLRLFLRVLTNLWGQYINRFSLTLTGEKFHWVLGYARNWSSHDGMAFPDLDEGDVAFLFMLTMRSLFLLSRHTEPFERELLPLIGDAKPLEMTYLKNQYDESWVTINELFTSNFNVDLPFFSGRVNELVKAGVLPPEQQVKMLYQIFWHCFYPHANGCFRPKAVQFEKVPFINALTKCCQRRSFE